MTVRQRLNVLIASYRLPKNQCASPARATAETTGAVLTAG